MDQHDVPIRASESYMTHTFILVDPALFELPCNATFGRFEVSHTCEASTRVMIELCPYCLYSARSVCDDERTRRETGSEQGGDLGPTCRPCRQWPNSVGGPFCPSSPIPRSLKCSERWIGCFYTISDDCRPPEANRDCVTRKRDRDYFFGGIHAIDQMSRHILRCVETPIEQEEVPVVLNLHLACYA